MSRPWTWDVGWWVGVREKGKCKWCLVQPEYNSSQTHQSNHLSPNVSLPQGQVIHSAPQILSGYIFAIYSNGMFSR